MKYTIRTMMLLTAVVALTVMLGQWVFLAPSSRLVAARANVVCVFAALAAGIIALAFGLRSLASRPRRPRRPRLPRSYRTGPKPPLVGDRYPSRLADWEKQGLAVVLGTVLLLPWVPWDLVTFLVYDSRVWITAGILLWFVFAVVPILAALVLSLDARK